MSTVTERAPNQAPARNAKQCDIILRCYAYKSRSGAFVAECVDLNLIVRASSSDRAIEKLIEAMTGYLKVACAGDYTGLIPRPSPLSRRFLYHGFLLLAQFSRRRRFRLFDSSPRSCLA